MRSLAFGFALSLTAICLSAASLELSSPAVKNNGMLPSKFTCEGEQAVPPLEISGVRAKAQSLVLTVDDTDVPKTMMPSGTFNHWVLWNLSATTKTIGEADKGNGLNGAGKAGWIGPCPPDEHHYVFKLYALDTKLEGKITGKSDVETAIKGHVLGEAQLITRYAKTKK
jgi:Raf kinase inhibitor-like YbhB/YbcL family protein